MSKITFGTDGWRAVIANDFNCYNVSRVTIAISKWLKLKYNNNNITVTLGNDCRFMGKHFCNLIANILASQNIKVILALNDFVSTPIISLATRHYKAALGIIITASHNPYYYSGIKLKSAVGGPLTESFVKEIEALISPKYEDNIKLDLSQEHIQTQNIILKDFETLYLNNIYNIIDINKIQIHSSTIIYDVMYGAGQKVAQKLLPNTKILHAELNPNFGYSSPEPIEKNLSTLKNTLTTKQYTCGVAIDGDADRLGLIDEAGNYVNSHKIIMLLIMYLCEYKGVFGDVITSFSCSDKISSLCKIYGINNITTKIGFKYICELMSENPKKYILGGEESGGIALSNHIPERDGIFVSLNIIALMIESKLSLTELVNELYKKIGYFSINRIDMTISNVEKQILRDCIKNDFKNYFKNKVIDVQNLDGVKFRFSNGSWVMLRLSGTEPILRIYCEALTDNESMLLIKETEEIINNICRNQEKNALA